MVRNAVVVGASIGGLVAARVLSEVADTVTVVDRDALPPRPGHRRGVPQSRQLHVLLSQGRAALEELFPGITEELSGRGAPLVDLHGQVHWVNDGFRMRRAPSGITGVGASRPVIEHAVRARVEKLANVELRPGTEAVGLVLHGERVTGLRVAGGGTLDADLVVDAGGRGSRTPVWLREHGFAAPAEERVPVEVTYVTRVYERDPRHLGGLFGALTNATPALPRTGIVAVQEDERFAVALSGVLGAEPPTDDAGFLAFAESLGVPEIAEVVREATPVTDPVRMRYPASVRRRYERLRRFPRGLLVFGDALCSFNPVYGQGMTVAAAEGLLLRRLLAKGGVDARRFFRGAAAVLEGPWSIAVGTDLRFPGIPGPRSARVRFVNAYVHRLHRAATADAVLGAAFLRVLNLVDPPTSLLRPSIVARVLTGA